jgi:hypothetical protein
MLRHITRERRPPDSTFASLPAISARVLSAQPRVRQQPVWRVRAERTATAVGLTAIAAVLVVATALLFNWDTPYQKLAKPIQSRIHFGTEDQAAPAVPARRASQVERATEPTSGRSGP